MVLYLADLDCDLWDIDESSGLLVVVASVDGEETEERSFDFGMGCGGKYDSASVSIRPVS